MNVAALLITATLAAADLSTVAGRVVDERGRPVAGARVFLEQGLGGAVQVMQASADGAYRFEDVSPVILAEGWCGGGFGARRVLGSAGP